jgi:hypothetical protein
MVRDQRISVGSAAGSVGGTPGERARHDLAGGLVGAHERPGGPRSEHGRELGVRDRVQAVVFAYESGVVLPGDPA